jgi:hypothetical protein
VCWIHLAQDRILWQTIVNTVMNLWVPWKAESFLTSSAVVSFSGWNVLHGTTRCGRSH